MDEAKLVQTIVGQTLEPIGKDIYLLKESFFSRTLPNTCKEAISHK